MEERTRKRVVILGGGFAGVYTARALEKALRQREDFEITLINKENHFVFQPLLAEVVSGSCGLLDVVSPIRRLLPRTDLYVRDLESVDLTHRTITTSPGFRPHACVMPFDYLVLALGNVTDFRGLRGLPEHALPFKNLGDALHLRNHVIHALEEAAIATDPRLRRQLLTFVVAGGGFSGVHVVAVLNDFVRGVARHYRHTDPAALRVVLLHSGDRLLPEVTEKLARFAHKMLHKRGVEVRLGSRLAAATGEAAVLTSGEHIATRTLVSTVPSSPHPIIHGLALPKSKDGRVLVNPCLEVEGAQNIWALGDCALVPMPSGGVCPPTAQHATRQARTAAHNIVAAIRGGEPQGFDFKGLGKLCSLGHHSAVAEILGLDISGFLAWFLWRTIYLMKLPGRGRRLKVASSWALDLLLPPELVQLKLDRSVGITQEHFEPGEEVFHQGDLGDRLYILLSGQAEVVHEDEGRLIGLARLGPGEYFGEMALLNQATRNATVRCLAPTDVLSLPEREFSTLAAHMPELRQKFEELMGQRRRATERILAQPLDRPGEPAVQDESGLMPAARHV
jgi:NADH dehydrogenase